MNFLLLATLAVMDMFLSEADKSKDNDISLGTETEYKNINAENTMQNV
jgi:hypothetical protein